MEKRDCKSCLKLRLTVPNVHVSRQMQDLAESRKNNQDMPPAQIPAALCPFGQAFGAGMRTLQLPLPGLLLCRVQSAWPGWV